MRQAVSLWEQEYLGENDSEKAIYEALKLPNTMMDGMVTVSYESSEYDILHEDGSVSLESVPDEGILVELQATFTCQKYIQTEIRSLQVILPPKGSRAWFQVQVARAIEKAEQSSRKAPEIQLPEQIAGSTISWMKPKSKEWMAVLLVGTCVVFVLEWRKKERKRPGREAASEKAAKGISSAGGTAGFADWIRNDNPPGMGTYFVDGRENAESTWKSDSFVSGGDANYLSGDAERVW